MLSEEEGWISVRQAADYCGVTPVTIRRWIAAGRLPATRVGPKILKVRLTDLEKMLRKA